MDEKTVAALIAGAVSIVVAVLGHFLGQRTQRDLARYKADLDAENEAFRRRLEANAASVQQQMDERIEKLKGAIEDHNSANSARRDYEYEARKRLYAEVEPILFQLYEALEEAHYRVRSLARTSRSGNLGIGPASWIDEDGYYLRSTMYKIVLPAAFLRLMQRSITFVDLGLDSTIHLRYLLLKLYSRTFTDDFVFSGLDPRLEYDPNHEDWQALREKRPEAYWRQALLVGDLEGVADAILVDGGPRRVMSFAEFDTLVDSPEGQLAELVTLFQAFAPARKPVLARMLVTQACLSQLILSTYLQPTSPQELPGRIKAICASSALADVLSWTDGATADDDLRVADIYLSERLSWIATGESWVVRDMAPAR